MLKMIITYVGIFAAVYLITSLVTRRKKQPEEEETKSSRRKFRSKPEKGPWVQIYDTDTIEDAKSVRARLEEEEMDCCLYEQGRKDVHGNALKGFGIAVPRSAMSRAQNLISRIPV